MKELVEFYFKLYQSKQYSLESLHTFLQGVELPQLSDSHRKLLDSSLTLVEMQLAVSSFPKSKAPEDDSHPIKAYKQYGEVILSCLLKVPKIARKQRCLSSSMCRANIVLLLKPGKEPLDPGSYLSFTQ